MRCDYFHAYGKLYNDKNWLVESIVGSLQDIEETTRYNTDSDYPFGIFKLFLQSWLGRLIWLKIIQFIINIWKWNLRIKELIVIFMTLFTILPINRWLSPQTIVTTEAQRYGIYNQKHVIMQIKSSLNPLIWFSIIITCIILTNITANRFNFFF
jgi:hypothetical protein